MIPIEPLLTYYAVPLAVIWALYLGLRLRSESRSRSLRAEAVEA